MPRIFISYRREDSKHAVGRLHAALKRHVRNPKRDIFIDIDNIPRGVDFIDHLDGQVAQCDVMLAVIGPAWISIRDTKTGERRLDDPNDFVRIEVASALKRGIPVVPVMLDDTGIPSAAELPDELKLLARRNGERLEHESFDSDVDRLIRNLPDAKPKPAPAPRGTAAASERGATRNGASWLGQVVALGLLAIGGSVWAVFANPGNWRGVAEVRSGEVAQDADPYAEQSDANPTPLASSATLAKPAAEPGAGLTQAESACSDVRAIVYFEFDRASLTMEARAGLEGALRKTFDCVVERVVIEAHEDLGVTPAYSQKLSERRADAVAGVLQNAGIEAGKISTIGFGDTRPLEVGVASPLNRRVEVTFALLPPPAATPQTEASPPR